VETLIRQPSVFTPALTADNVNQTEFFLHALRRYARREGLGIEV
jgi:hypothetical protein